MGTEIDNLVTMTEGASRAKMGIAKFRKLVMDCNLAIDYGGTKKRRLYKAHWPEVERAILSRRLRPVKAKPKFVPCSNPDVTC